MGTNPALKRLALSIVRENFGDANEAVMRSLISKGPQTLGGLVGNVDLPHFADRSLQERLRETDKIVRASLMAMLQFSFVKTYRIQPEPTSRNPNPLPYSQYEADATAIVRSLRIPLYFGYVRSRFPDEPNGTAATAGTFKGTIHEAVLNALVANGRLRLEQIVVAVAAKKGLSKETAEAPVMAAFEAMLRERFVERAPPAMLAEAAGPIFARRVGRAAAVAKPGSKRALEEEAARKLQEPSLHYVENRYKLRPTPVPDVGTDAKPAKAPSKKLRLPEPKTVMPPQLVKPDPDDKKVVDSELWQISHGHFLRLMRYKECAAYMLRQQGSRGGLLAEAMLRASTPPAGLPAAAEAWSPAVTPFEIARNLPPAKGGDDDDDADLRKSLGNPAQVHEAMMAMVQEDPDLVRKDAARGDSAYCLNLEKIMQQVKLQKLQGAIRGRFGLAGVMVWNTVLWAKQAETKTVHETVLQPHATVRRLLWEMFKAGFVAMQDIPKSPDHAPSNTIYTFKVDFQAAKDQLTSNLLKAVANLRDRLNFELQQRKDVVEAARAGDWAALQGRQEDFQAMQAIQKQIQCDVLALAPELALLLEL